MPITITGPDGSVKVSYAGAVLTTRERNYHDDSDFYAMVWDEESGKIREVGYATTRAWTYKNGAAADATPKIRAKAVAYLEPLLLSELFDAALATARTPQVGSTVRTTREIHKRKPKVTIEKGTEGVVFNVAPDQFRTYYRNGYNRPENHLRAGVRTAAGFSFFLAVEDLEVVVDVHDAIDLDTLREQARRGAASGVGGLWQIPFLYKGLAYV